MSQEQFPPNLVPTPSENMLEVRLRVVAWLESLTPDAFTRLIELFPTDVKRSVNTYSGTPQVWLGVYLVRNPQHQARVNSFGNQ